MLLKNVMSNWFGLLVLGLISFCLTPMMIHYLGDFQFGMWILVSSVTDNYGLLDIGMRHTLQRFVARSKGADLPETVNEIFSTALAVTLAFALLILGVSILLAYVLPSYFKLDSESQLLFSKLILMLGASVALMLPVRLFGTYLCGLQRFDLYNISSVITGIVRAVLIVSALKLDFGAVGVGVATLMVAIVGLPVHIWMVRSVDPGLQFHFSLIKSKRAWELLSFSFYMFLNTVGDRLRSYMDSFVIARVLGVALVTPFSVAGRLMEYFKFMMVAAIGPLMPRFSALDGQHRQRELQELFIFSTKLTALLSVFAGSILLLNGRVLLHLWVGDRFLSSFALLAVLTVGYIISLAQEPSTSLLIARGKHRPLGVYSTVEGLLNLGLSIYWALRYGLIGVALGTAVPMLIIRTLIQPWFALRAVGISYREYFVKALARPVLVWSLFVGLSIALGRAIGGLNLHEFVLSVSIQSAIFGLLAYFVGLTRFERVALFDHWGARRTASDARHEELLIPENEPVATGVGSE